MPKHSIKQLKDLGLLLELNLKEIIIEVICEHPVTLKELVNHPKLIDLFHTVGKVPSGLESRLFELFVMKQIDCVGKGNKRIYSIAYKID